MPSEASVSLLTIARDLRSIHLRMLQAAGAATDTAGSCLHASILLCQAINQFGVGRARICGGRPQDGTGYFDGRELHGHFWVEVLDAHGLEWIVDITADQFGADPVVVILVAQGRGRYRASNAQKVRAHIHAWCELAGIPAPDTAMTLTGETSMSILSLEEVRRRVRKGASVLWPYRGEVEEGSVIHVDGERIALCWLEGHHSRNDDITFADVLAVNDENAPEIDLGLWIGRGHLTEAGQRWQGAHAPSQP